MMRLEYDIQIHIIGQSKLVKSTFICKIIAFYMFIRIRKISTCLNNHLNSGLKQFSLTCSILYLTWLFVRFEIGYPATIQYHLACVYHTDENRTENIFTDACSLDHVILAGEDSWG